MEVIAVTSGKGGVGKTTIAINLGAILSEKFKKDVTIIDCNLTTPHISLHLGIYYSPTTLNHVLRGEVPVDESVFVHFTGMKVIPASLSIKDLTGVDALKLEKVLEELKYKTEIVLLDTAPGFGREALSALRISNKVLYVTTPHIPSVMDIVRGEEVRKELGIDAVGIILNMVRGSADELKPYEIEDLTGLKVIASIKYDPDILRSLSAKLPLSVFNPRNKNLRELLKVGSLIAGVPYVERKSLWRRILDKFKLSRRSSRTFGKINY